MIFRQILPYFHALGNKYAVRSLLRKTIELNREMMYNTPNIAQEAN